MVRFSLLFDSCGRRTHGYAGMNIYSKFLEKVFMHYDLLLEIILKHFKVLKNSEYLFPSPSVFLLFLRLGSSSLARS